MSPESSLPLLLSVRFWTEAVNPEYPEFIDTLRATGQDVIDIHVPHEGFHTLDEWAGGVVDQILEEWDRGSELHLLGYCGGGDLLIAALPILEDHGVHAAYVGLIDTFTSQLGYNFRKGHYSLYQVPWSGRVWRQLMRVTPPDRESFPSVIRSVMHRSVRSVIEFPQRGWRSKNRRNPAIHEQVRISYRCAWRGVKTPAHLYICPSTIEKYVPGDPSAGLARTLLGGFVSRSIGGTHETCITPPHSAALIERITADRSAVVSGAGAFQ